MNSIVAAKAQTVCAKEAHPLFMKRRLSRDVGAMPFCLVTSTVVNGPNAGSSACIQVRGRTPARRIRSSVKPEGLGVLLSFGHVSDGDASLGGGVG